MIKLCLGRFSIVLSASPGALVFGLTPVQAQPPVLVIEQLGSISQEMLACPGSAAEGYATLMFGTLPASAVGHLKEQGQIQESLHRSQECQLLCSAFANAREQWPA